MVKRLTHDMTIVGSSPIQGILFLFTKIGGRCKKNKN